MPMCRACGNEKIIHARGQCAHCYWVDYQREERRRNKRKAGNKFWKISITPRSIMKMNPDKIVENWGKICRAVGL